MSFLEKEGRADVIGEISISRADILGGGAELSSRGPRNRGVISQLFIIHMYVIGDPHSSVILVLFTCM